MQSIPLEKGPVQVTGSFDFDFKDTGMIPRRLPEWSRIQVQPFVDVVVSMASGIRLEFVTDSERIELDARLARFNLGSGSVADAVFDLEIDHGDPVSALGDGGDLFSMDKDRGMLSPGMKADVNVIDMNRLAELHPKMVRDFPCGASRVVQKARGYKATVCNGVVILEDDELTGNLGGGVVGCGRRATG